MEVRKMRAEMRMGRSIFDLPLRVTFYARVSTDMDAQLNSLDNQVQYYTELIQSKPNWTFVPGYIDEGISGGTTKKRDDFNRMIADAKAGRFDFIITKEISRFSRSTVIWRIPTMTERFRPVFPRSTGRMLHRVQPPAFAMNSRLMILLLPSRMPMVS